MFNRAFASAKVDCPEGQGYDVVISSFSAAFFLLGSAADFLCLHRSLLFTPGDKIQNRLKMEKPRSLHLAGLADGHAAEVAIFRALIKPRPAEARIKFKPMLGRSHPFRASVGLVV